MAERPEQGVKADSGKLRWDLIPWDALTEVVKVLGHGAQKYADRNWERGINYSRVFAAMQRHAVAWFRGQSDDAESRLSHMAHAACCALFLLAFECRGRDELDDRPYTPDR